MPPPVSRIPVAVQFHLQCRSCGNFSTGAQPGEARDSFSCGCCPEDHDHAEAANACPGGHEGAECPVGASCIVSTPAGEPCPGGHCAKGVPGCTVCRPLTLTVSPVFGPAGEAN